MPEGNVVHAKVNRKGYTFRGRSLGLRQIVKVSEDQLKSAQRINPPYLVAATDEEVKKARTIVDLAAVKPRKAANVKAAEEARPAVRGATPAAPASPKQQ